MDRDPLIHSRLMNINAFFFFFFTRVTGPRRSLSLKLSDTRVYAPQIQARLGTIARIRQSGTYSGLGFQAKVLETLLSCPLFARKRRCLHIFKQAICSVQGACAGERGRERGREGAMERGRGGGERRVIIGLVLMTAVDSGLGPQASAPPGESERESEGRERESERATTGYEPLERARLLARWLAETRPTSGREYLSLSECGLSPGRRREGENLY